MMLLFLDFSLPFKDPVLIFCLVLLIILLTPILFTKIRFPSLVGLILAGVLIGPYGLNLLLRDASIELFGTVGLLYIMFIAGLEIDLTDFKINKNKSIIFGIITFLVPMILGTIAGLYILDFNMTTSILLASMFASHTLLAYPITSGYGINKIEPVNITVGGTIITDTAALLVLAVIAGMAQGDIGYHYWIRLVVSLSLFVIIVVWLVPLIARWSFKRMEGKGEAQFIFSLSVVFGAAFLAEMAGVEAIIGAFLAGLALNRFIPHTSPLMNRIEFVGNTLFIPFFLIGVGMLVDVRVMVQGFDALFVAFVMIVVALVAKWLAAYLTQKTFKYSINDRNLIFGLSSAQAAATLAVVLVGYNLEIFNVNVLNGTILMILVTCLVSSFVTEKAGAKIAEIEKETVPDIASVKQRILVPVSNPKNIEGMLDIAIILKDQTSDEPIYALSVVKDDSETTEKLMINQKVMENAVKYGSSTDNSIRIVSRIDTNIADGILRCIREMLITDIVVGWDGKINSQTHTYGPVLGTLLEKADQTILVCRMNNPVNTIKKIVVAVPPLVENEETFEEWIEKLKVLSKELGGDLHFFSTQQSEERIKKVLEASKPSVDAHFKTFDHWEDFLVLAREMEKDDLFVIIFPRTESRYYKTHLTKIPGQLGKYFYDFNFIILYPSRKVIQVDNEIPEGNKKKRLSLIKHLVGGT